MTWFIDSIKSYPELALFLTLAIGFAVGKIKIGSFKIGSVTGVLITGVIVGQLNTPIAPTVKSIFFLMFIFTLGYTAGPEFFKGLRKESFLQVVFTVIVCTVGLASAIIVGKFFSYDAGQASGLISGSLTQSSIIGVAQDTLSKLPMSDAEKKAMSDFIPIGYAVTYIFGTLGVTFILSTFGPKILGINLKDECKKLEGAQNTILKTNSNANDKLNIQYRAFRLNSQLAGKTIAEVKTLIDRKYTLFCIDRINRKGKIFTPEKDTVLELNDEITVLFKLNDLNSLNLSLLGTEVFDHKLVDLPLGKLNIFINKNNNHIKTVENLKKNIINSKIFISTIKRNGENLDFDSNTLVKKKDIITFVGPKNDLEDVCAKFGKILKDSDETDMAFIGLGILLGGLMGIPALVLGGISISLSTSGGALIMGLIFGLLHSKYPNVGNVPKSAAWLLNNMGLTGFVAVVGINAGPSFISGLKTSGMSFLFAGIIVTIMPVIAGILIGKYIFKWNGALILGACAGAMTVTAALGAVCEKGESNTPVLGYTIPYAVANILLTVWGAVIIIFFS